MNLDKTKQQIVLRKTAKVFAETFIKPNSYDWDEREFFPKELLHNAGGLGFMGILKKNGYQT